MTLVITACAYVLASQGLIPSPAWLLRITSVSLTSSQERYPCEGCACGCASARECWTHCCCHTVEERLAWAMIHEVTPPSDIEFTSAQWTAGRQLATQQLARSAAPPCPLCEAATTQSAAETIACDSKETCSAPCDATTCCDKPSRSTKPGLSALACKGIQQLLAFAPVISRPTSIRLEIPPYTDDDPDVGVRSPIASDWSIVSRSLDVPKPPPRATPAL